MSEGKLGKRCTNIGCIRNTGMLSFSKSHCQTDTEMRCELQNPRRVDNGDGTWHCEDEVRYEDLGGV